MSIRSYLTLQIALVYFVVLSLMVFVGGYVIDRSLRSEIDDILLVETERIAAAFDEEFSPESGNDDIESAGAEVEEELHELYGSAPQFGVLKFQLNGASNILGSGTELSPGELWKIVGPFSPGFHDADIEDIKHRILRSEHDWGTLVLGQENSTFNAIVDKFKQLLIWFLPATLLFALLAGRVLASFAMKPVAATASAAENITLTNLSQRLPKYKGRDEFGQLIETLNQMIGRIDREVRKMLQFTQDAAHELKTPLTIQRGELELACENDNLNEDIQAGLQKALDRTISMSQVVESLLMLAQTDAARYPLQKSSFRLDLLFLDIVEDIRMLTAESGLEVKPESCEEMLFFGDKQLIQRLMLNLCDNAVRYTQKGSICLSLDKTDGGVRFSVQDSGIGIPLEQQPHIFDRFYKVDKARTSYNSSSGLGLSICKWIVDAHNGEIEVDSDGLTGTRVTVTLPMLAS